MRRPGAACSLAPMVETPGRRPGSVPPMCITAVRTWRSGRIRPRTTFSHRAVYTIWRNSDVGGAGTWSQVFTAPFMGRTSLAIAPSQQATIYAMATSIGGDPHYENGLLAVYRSTSNGDLNSWTTQVTNADPDITNTLLLTDSRSITGIRERWSRARPIQFNRAAARPGSRRRGGSSPPLHRDIFRPAPTVGVTTL